MPQFQFTAADAKGEQMSGTIESTSEAEAIQQLRSQGYYPLQVVEAGKGKLAAKKGAKKGKAPAGKKKEKSAVGGRIKPKLLMIFTRQLATLIDSGLPLLRGLTVLAKQEPNPVLKGTIAALADSVQSGSTFSESLAQHPKIFNKLYVNMVKAGELGGVLEVVLVRLAEYQEKAHKLKNKIVSAMVYPVIVMFIAVGILVFLMLFIVPKFESMFAELGNAELPAISRIVFGTSKFFLNATLVPPIPNVVWFAVLIVLIGVGFNAWGKTKKGRRSLDTLKLRLPIFGDIQLKSAVARFSRTLGTLVTSGVPILQALNITRDTAGNVVVSDAIEKVHEAVKEGESIVSPLQSSKIFPAMVISMVDVGEETGQLPEMLLKVADVYDDEVDNAVTALTSILEPIMIVVLALVVGAVVFALFLPLIKIISEMGNM
ncbi:type II secretion system F family protein [Luteolibacter flavescens]|uniref:Type II secretion system F family protein n=1 Tax=Luteolibacter flavescens TaxID=1859460 RepID=A0ABT3FT93_9BACT|nr:type II secretion system F family protein [Luteolibacter flavescens]MCW1886798.1 type II secretion system F family protein [Luteolibacter flavescens]